MKEIVIKYLKEKGYNIDNTYYDFLEICKQWYNDSLEEHIFYRDCMGYKRRLNTLAIAKPICEDFASLIYSETDEIKCDIENQENYINEILKNNNFIELIPKTIEEVCWSGTVAAVIRLENVNIINNKFVANSKTKKKTIFVNAQNIIPLRIEDGQIIDCAFVSEIIKNNKKLLYIETHIFKENGYEITNIYLDLKTGKEENVDGIIKTYNTSNGIPLFSIFKTPKNNLFESSNGLGFPVFGNSLNQLKSCDIAYNNFVKDIELGGKKIIYNKKLINYKTVQNSDGTTRQVIQYPDDISKQQFMLVGDELDGESKEMIHEYNPLLRVDENIKAIQIALDILTFKCGLGKKFYSFENGTFSKTATEYSGEKQNLILNCKKFRNNLTKFIENIIKSNLYLDKIVFNRNVNYDCNITIDNKDGFLVDDEAVKESARRDLSLGVISKLEYRMIVYKETEEIAKKMLGKIESEMIV